MKRLEAAIILSIVVLGSAVDLCAQDGSGGTRSIFSVGAGSRAISMGGAFTAIGDDPSAIYYNPAALRVNRHACVMVNHIQLFSGFSDASYDYIGLVYPTLSVGSVGLGFMTVGTDGIREFDRKGVYQDDISYREWQAMLAYAFDLPWTYIGKVTMGSSVKILNQSVGDFSDTGAGLDVGFLCRPPYTGGLVLGCNLQDIVGAEIKLVAVSEKVDRTLMFGAGYSYLFKNGSMLSLAVQMDMPERADRDLRFGAEYSFRQTISFRVGFDSEQVTAGVGFGWRGFEADYGYFSREEAGSSHPISLSARIGVSIDDKIRVREERRMIEEERRLQQLFAERVSSHIATAENCRREGDLEKALDELKIVLEYDPSNNAAAETLIVVRGEILREQEKRTRTAEKALLISQYFKLGLKYYSSNEYILARAEWQNVLNLEPPNEEARDYLSRTEEKLTEQVNQHMSRAVKLENSGQLAAALGEWSIVGMIDPGSDEARAASERISKRLEDLSKDYKDASNRLEIIELFENALTAFSSGRYSETIEIIDRLLDRQPDHEEARKLQLRARRRLTPLTDNDKKEIRRLFIAGMKHFTQNNYAAAVEQWRKILEIDPDNESVRKNIEEAEMRLERIGSPEAD